jgi:hypothetical protein
MFLYPERVQIELIIRQIIVGNALSRENKKKMYFKWFNRIDHVRIKVVVKLHEWQLKYGLECDSVARRIWKLLVLFLQIELNCLPFVLFSQYVETNKPDICVLAFQNNYIYYLVVCIILYRYIHFYCNILFWI